jgi:hypothetical protein
VPTGAAYNAIADDLPGREPCYDTFIRPGETWRYPW